MSTNASAVARVLATAELLEAILLEADSQTVLLAQRVNCYFQACIQGSSKLQQKLFFRLLHANFQPEDLASKPRINPLLLYQDCAALNIYKDRQVELEGMSGGFQTKYSKSQSGDGVLMVDFSDFDLDLLRQTLATQQPTFLDMYLCHNVGRKTQIRVWNEDRLVRDPGLDVDWQKVKAQVQMGTFGQLLEVAMSMQQAAESLAKSETQRRQSEHDELNERMHWDFGTVEMSEYCDWKEHFSRQQLDMLEDTPKVLLF